MADWQIGLLPARPLRPPYNAPKRAVSCRVTANQPRSCRRASSRCWSACCFWAAAVGLVYAWTWGFSAFTSYSYALSKAGPLPRLAPDISFVDQFGHERQLASLRGRHVLLHVFYGSCLTICPIVIEELREVYSGLSAAQRSKLVILSISVDSLRDTTERLLDLWREEGAFAGWIMAQPADNSIDRVTRGVRYLGLRQERRDDQSLGRSISDRPGRAHRARDFAAIEQRSNKERS